ncbi:MAG: Dabb family protein [Clostridia bacterium]|nr:Dabb family protein [Clostridia bacterium]
MIRHIVMWKFADEAEGHTREENLDIVAGKLKALYESGKIEGLRSLELGKDIGRTEMSYDMVLITDFDSFDCLRAYKIHPDHVVISQYVKKVRVARTTVDFEI